MEAGRTSHLFKRGNDYADIFAKRGADTHKPAFRVAKTFVACASLAKQAARWAAEAHFRGWDGTTPGLPRRDHGYGRRERDSSESGTRRLLRWLQVRFPIGFPKSFPHAFRKTVISTHARSEGTAFPLGTSVRYLGVELWTELQRTGVGRVCWRRTGSTVIWWQISPLRRRVLQLARQTEGLATHVLFQQSLEHGPSETLAICALWAAMDLPAPTKGPHLTTSGTLSCRQWCTSALEKRCSLRYPKRKIGKVALTCRFACDSMCEELYDWDGAERG